MGLLNHQIPVSGEIQRVFGLGIFLKCPNYFSTTTVPCFNLPPSTSNTEIRNNIETNFFSNKSMPDITNNTLRKTSSTNKLKGNIPRGFHDKVKNWIVSGSNSNSGLPDVTASTGFGGFLPAKELKTGSVMDILGNYKHSDT